MIKDLTPNQQAAVYMHIFAPCDDWQKLFIIAEGPERFNKLTDKSKRQTVSNFKRSDKINEAIQEVKYFYGLKEKELTQKIRTEIENEKNGTGTGVKDDINFLDPDQFLKHANEQANRIKDDKERRSWLEMIAKLMNYKEQNDQEATEIKKFYIMKTCETCEIYEKCKNCSFAGCPNVTL